MPRHQPESELLGLDLQEKDGRSAFRSNGDKPQTFIYNIRKANRPLSCGSFNPSASRNRHALTYR